VGIVGLGGDVAGTHLVERPQSVVVVDEAPVDRLEVVGRGWLGYVLGLRPALVVLPHLVDSLECIGDPADLALGVEQLELGHPNQ
jgi:hypothetical protein